MEGIKVAILMGSKNDLEVVKPAYDCLKSFGVEAMVRVISAHRTPDKAMEFAKKAKDNGIEVIIAAAGKAAHLAGIIAALTPLPVIGIPIKSSTMDGLDSLLSTVQMPTGVPVACVAINGAENAALLATQILSIKYNELQEKIVKYKKSIEEKINDDDSMVGLIF